MDWSLKPRMDLPFERGSHRQKGANGKSGKRPIGEDPIIKGSLNGRCGRVFGREGSGAAGRLAGPPFAREAAASVCNCGKTEEA